MISPASFEKQANLELRRSFAARAITLPFVALLGLVTLRLQVSYLGEDGFAIVALLATLPALIPIGDLGLGAAVTNAVAAATGRPNANEFCIVLGASLRLLCIVAGGVIAVGVALGVLGIWSRLLSLGNYDGVDAAMALVSIGFGLGLPLSLGHRVLIGSGRNHVSVLLVGGAVGVTTLLTGLGVAVGATLPWFALVAALPTATSGAAAWLMAMRSVPFRFAPVARVALRRDVQRPPLRGTAVPMFLISLALPLAYQSDRLILNATTGLAAIATYTVAIQMYSPLLSLAGATGQSLWASFARARSMAYQIPRRQHLALVARFLAFGVFGAACLILFGQQVGSILSGGAIIPSVPLLASFGMLLIVQSSFYPTGMLLTDDRGLSLQAICAVAMLLCNLALSVVLARWLGVVGPVVGSVLSIILCMMVPCMTVANRRLSPRMAV